MNTQKEHLLIECGVMRTALYTLLLHVTLPLLFFDHLAIKTHSSVITTAFDFSEKYLP